MFSSVLLSSVALLLVGEATAANFLKNEMAITPQMGWVRAAPSCCETSTSHHALD